MPLPNTDREVYGRNPLAEVVAQLRFSPILRIEAEPPAQFQELIRNNYPHYRQVAPAGQLPRGIPDPVRNLIQGMGAAAGPTQHIFETGDRQWVVTLARDVLDLKTTSYARWEDFRERLRLVRDALEQVYQPLSYSRIGLRYVDIIRRSLLGLDRVPWWELLNPAVGGELSTPEFGESIESASRQLHCQLDGNNAFLTLRTGIALAEPANPGGTREKCFLIDCDFHTHQPTEINHVTSILDIFNRASGNLFRWAIRPRLRDALEPRPLA